MFHTSDRLLETLFPFSKAIPAGLSILLDVCAIVQFVYIYPCDIQGNKVAKGVQSSWDALSDLLESIRRFVDHLDIYTKIPLTPLMIDIVVKIMVELISTLALVTEELKQRRSSEFVPLSLDMSLFNATQSNF